MLTRLSLGILWLLHFLPARVLAALGRTLGSVLYHVPGKRKRVVQVNLRLGFPELSDHERARLARAHFRAFGQSVLEHALLSWGSREAIVDYVEFKDVHHLTDHVGQPLIMLAPHFVGLDAAGARITTILDRAASMYARQKNTVIDQLLRQGRQRFGHVQLFSRHDGIRPVVRAIREGVPFYYLPDMDYGRRESIFVPFFGVQTATLPTLSRLARLTGARVVVIVPRQLAQGGYSVQAFPPWDNFPTDDEAADARRMNAFIEAQVREMPEQYYWLHRRFKTRPPGDASFY